MSSFPMPSRSFRSYLPGPFSLAQLRHYMLAFGIFLIGSLFSFIVFRFYQLQDEQQSRAEFNHLADIRLFSIQNLFEESLEQISILRQFYQINPQVTQSHFKKLTAYPLNQLPYCIAIGWSNTQAFAHSIPLNSPAIHFTDLTNQSFQRVISLPLNLLESQLNVPSLFVDEKNYPDFVNLLRQAPDSSIALVSQSIDYYQQGEKLGYFILDSISRDNVWRGTLIGLFDFTLTLQNARHQLEPIGVNVGIYDITNGIHQLLYWGKSRKPDVDTLTEAEQTNQKVWTRTRSFDMGDRVWSLEAIPNVKMIQNYESRRFWELPIIGMLISGLTAFYFLFLVNQRIVIEHEVNKRTEELATINRILQQEVHERQRIEKNFTEKQQYLEKRHEALEYLTKFTTSELRNAVNEVILRTSSVLQIDRVSIWFYEKGERTDLLSCAGLYSFTTNSFSNHLEFDSVFFPHYFQALNMSSYLIIPSSQDAELNQELASYLGAFHIISKMDIPIVFEGKLLGVLCCEETREYRKWPLEDRHFGQTIADIIAIMIEESARRKAERALQESEERLRFITQKAIDAIISVTEKGEIVSWNYGAEQMFGYSEVEVLGKSLNLILPNLVIDNRELATKPIELQGKKREGPIFPVEMSHTRWKSGAFYFDTVIIRDITERKENERRLIRAMREAEAANQAKSSFLTTISHELRTPLNAIIGFDQCLLMGMDGPLNEEQKVSLHKIEKSSFHLLSLINDILDLAKIEAKKMELEMIPFNITELITSCVEDMQLLASQKNLVMHLSVDKPQILVEMDKIRIRQVFLNLLSNAVKFTKKGSIHVTLTQSDNFVKIDVTDTGIGLSSLEKTKMFRPFSQADSSITRKYGGTGLGLAISKKIVELHGGNIEVTSQKGVGSTFTVKLPKIQ